MSPDAALVATLFAVDPDGLGGVALRAPACSARDDWLDLMRALLPASTPIRRMPVHISDTALLGGLDLGATLQAGRPVVQPGLLAQADGGVVIVAMAERLPAGTSARIAATMDTREVAIERDGIALRRAVRLGVVALDEGATDDERLPGALLDRLAFYVILDGRPDDDLPVDWCLADVIEARQRLSGVSVRAGIVEALCAATLALGIGSSRAPLLALRAARAAAALAGLDEVDDDHVALAARLVLAPRATQLPSAPAENQKDTEQADDADANELAKTDEDKTPREPESGAESETENAGSSDDALPESDGTEVHAGDALAETVMAAARASIPAGLLATLALGKAAKSRSQAAGRSGVIRKNQARGRPTGARRGEPRAGARLNVIETLRAAAPWQRLRQREEAARGLRLSGAPLVSSAPASRQRIYVRKEDFHVTRFRQKGSTTTVFVVDASGSSALNRLAEAKGAVELLLADCYVRRDQVSVLAFRGKTAELLLPPTRSLARAKRSLAGLPGGGGTPLACAIDAARVLADQISRHGEMPIVVLLTDGRGNVARDGSTGRERAADDAMAAAREMRLAGVSSLLLDTSPQPQSQARLLAQEMGATYLPLPHAGAQQLSQAVKAASNAALS